MTALGLQIFVLKMFENHERGCERGCRKLTDLSREASLSDCDIIVRRRMLWQEHRDDV